ncbi:MAG: ATP-binding cassette domain-containing protein [Desulfobacteraceae bacterium]|nr:ATP-binding cassette domain-containing protein [Desulfobacteraceae bacterium]
MTERIEQIPISVKNVTYTYPEQDSPALKNVTLEVKKGEFLVIMGPNGSGKTTLCLLLNGVIPNVLGGRLRGRTEVMGLDTRRHHVYELAQHVGMVLQDPEAQLFTSSVRSEAAFAAENLGVPREEMIERIDWALDVVRLQDFVQRPPPQLSGGQKQRLTIAAALVMRPLVLVLDEPTSQLDPIGSQEVFSVLRDLNQNLSMTVVISTHKSEHATRFADRITVLNEGQIDSQGSPAEVFSHVELMDRIYVQVPAVTRVEWDLREALKRKRFSVLLEDARASLSKLMEERGVPKQSVLDHRLSIPTPPVPNTPYIELKNLNFQYPGTDKKALDDISITVEKGEFVGIIGQNGAGKTTLVKHIIGLLKPSSGQVILDGKDVAEEAVEDMARTVGLALQNPDAQLFAMSVAEEVAFGSTNLDLPEKEVAERVDRALAATGLEKFREAYPFNLSFGDRRKLSVAAVVSMEPDVLIFDEPTTGQDYKGRRELADIAKKLNEMGHTILMVTHDMDLIAEYTRRLIVMGDAKVLLDGPTAEVFQQVEILAETFIAPPQVTQLAMSLAEYDIPGDILVADELSQVLQRKAGI